MNILAVDPGDTETGFVLYNQNSKAILDFGKIPNLEFLSKLKALNICRSVTLEAGHVPIEFPVARGQMAGNNLFETIWWIGRYCEVLNQKNIPFTKIDRSDCKMHICHMNSVTDTQIRRALIDRWGGDAAIAGPKCPKCKGKGGEGRGKDKVACPKCNGTGQVTPGPLHGISADAWAALGIAVTFAEDGHLRRQREDEARVAQGMPTRAEVKAAAKARKKEKRLLEKQAAA